jgi:hypothetical protein
LKKHYLPFPSHSFCSTKNDPPKNSGFNFDKAINPNVDVNLEEGIVSATVDGKVISYKSKY